MKTLERASWVAGIIGTIFAITWGIGTYLRPPEPSISTHTSGQTVSGTQNVIIQGNNNVIGSPPVPPFSTSRNTENVQGGSAVKPSTRISPEKTSFYPEEIVLRDCLRVNNNGELVNYCGSTIGVTWCYSLGYPEWDDETYRVRLTNWSFLTNTCRYGRNYESPAIPPGGVFEMPTYDRPTSPDGQSMAELKFVRAVKLP